jgi:hypothetical protein
MRAFRHSPSDIAGRAVGAVEFTINKQMTIGTNNLDIRGVRQVAGVSSSPNYFPGIATYTDVAVHALNDRVGFVVGLDSLSRKMPWRVARSGIIHEGDFYVAESFHGKPFVSSLPRRM